eukprot:4344206-Pleurochrysis_carterae.AAC.2
MLGHACSLALARVSARALMCAHVCMCLRVRVRSCGFVRVRAGSCGLVRVRAGSHAFACVLRVRMRLCASVYPHGRPNIRMLHARGTFHFRCCCVPCSRTKPTPRRSQPRTLSNADACRVLARAYAYAKACTNALCHMHTTQTFTRFRKRKQEHATRVKSKLDHTLQHARGLHSLTRMHTCMRDSTCAPGRATCPSSSRWRRRAAHQLLCRTERARGGPLLRTREHERGRKERAAVIERTRAAQETDSKHGKTGAGKGLRGEQGEQRGGRVRRDRASVRDIFVSGSRAPPKHARW